MHSIICDEIPIAGLSCEWDIVAVSNSTIIAVEFTTTSLESADPANNRAEFKDDNGVVITSVTSTEFEELAPTSSPGTAVMVTLNVAPGTSTIPILEFGFIAVATDNEDCQGKNEETIELEIGGELTISSGNFPSHYDNDHVCIFIVIPKNGRALSLNVVYMLTESFQCPEADPVTLTFGTV
ncbi:uncharacterized protein LOC117318137 [Pecten maximus]|uniref:uncharacterized protein LOC117318137 n=1 Tax=Pecten maximus TaxID=6579 RepID=UPI0014583433|nr:uncharacterized protein LOC117318137 [Pecten maximus]